MSQQFRGSVPVSSRGVVVVVVMGGGGNRLGALAEGGQGRVDGWVGGWMGAEGAVPCCTVLYRKPPGPRLMGQYLGS